MSLIDTFILATIAVIAFNNHWLVASHLFFLWQICCSKLSLYYQGPSKQGHISVSKKTSFHDNSQTHIRFDILIVIQTVIITIASATWVANPTVNFHNDWSTRITHKSEGFDNFWDLVPRHLSTHWKYSCYMLTMKETQVIWSVANY